ncbi:unnamed protein product [Kuraishia capsulata CBS 1993]|uniref:Glucosamine 6-phosphate N-acetyltransferase n=1 Tax=Kuraishia capsulata CBS 1993 TaxID=1382522 RepID=W6MPJ5_9ASCO|nr:uncharacterized protein KUCA_T00004235001 [Kuraishia capsulata CBS 1993]CDK28253.1 unnamed protein product [Kuraishia capsulata CBS 1993]
MVESLIPAGYTIRPLMAADYDNGVLDCLKGLTTVGDVSRLHFEKLLAYWDARRDMYHNMVIVDNSGLVVATGTLLVEYKLIHACGKVGHIEDISVNENQQGKKLGIALIRYLLQVAKDLGCYKTILDCSEHNVGFYEKCGLKVEGIEMGYRY